MNGCIIKDCQEEATHYIHHQATGQEAMICETHVIFIEGYDASKSEEE